MGTQGTLTLRSGTTHAGLILALAFGLMPRVFAQEWPGWRGPTRDGTVPASDVPAWSSRLVPRWTVDVGGGRSSPIVSDGRVFVHSRRAGHEVVTALALATGERLWQTDYPAPFTQNTIVPAGFMGPFATPLASAGRLFTVGVTGVLSSWDVNTGKLLWRHDYSDDTRTSDLFGGTAASPLLEVGALIVQVGSDVSGGRILSLDPATGDQHWAWEGPGPAYASPVVANIEGRRQIIAFTHRSLMGLDVATGSALWSTPFEDEWIENIATPIWTGRHVVVSGPRLGTHAFTIRRDADEWRVDQGWTNREVTMYMTSPVLAEGTIYGHSTKRGGQFVALNAATGAVVWASEGRAGDFATALLAGERLVLLTGEAELIVAATDTDVFRIEHVFEVANGATWAMPVPLQDGLIIRTDDTLIRLSSATR
ncbi:MAG: PQQ-binding-like beta-propeller repeat protein [Acidobacteriota bacterium]|nr:PQQ-binding-like beta-propeller repeat protein [Acidobacteriota bacterium]